MVLFSTNVLMWNDPFFYFQLWNVIRRAPFIIPAGCVGMKHLTAYFHSLIHTASLFASTHMNNLNNKKTGLLKSRTTTERKSARTCLWLWVDSSLILDEQSHNIHMSSTSSLHQRSAVTLDTTVLHICAHSQENLV